MNKKKRIQFILVLLVFVIACFVFLSVMFKGDSSNEDDSLITVVKVSNQEKISLGKELAMTNALHKKALETGKSLNEGIKSYQQEEIGVDQFQTLLVKANKQLTFYYLLALQNGDYSEKLKDIREDVDYDLYLMRRGSEEAAKYVTDNSTLRLEVGSDLLTQALKNENVQEAALKTEFARYEINPEFVVVDPTVWDKEEQFLKSQPDLVNFADLSSKQKNSHEYYVKHVNDSFMLIAWEIQKMYLAKGDYLNDEINSEQLNSMLDGSGYVIFSNIEEMQSLKQPKGLQAMYEDTNATLTLYKDAVLEIQKFRMDKNVKHFDTAKLILNQADAASGRIGEFVQTVRTQYGF